MRRLMPLALGFATFLWIGTACTGALPADDRIAATLVATTHHSQEPDADPQWRPQHHTSAAVTESVWKSALVHAELAATPAARVFDLGRVVSAPDPPARSTPHYLRHTPLLI